MVGVEYVSYADYLKLQKELEEAKEPFKIFYNERSKLEKERDQIENQLKQVEFEKQLEKRALKDRYEVQIKDRDDAIERLKDLQSDTSADGERVRDSYLVEADILERGQRAGDARMALDRGLGVFEGDPVLLYARAMLLERGDEVDAALADLRTIIDENPGDAQALNAYGYTLAERRGQYAAALPYIERAHALLPESAPILDSLGWVRFRLGERQSSLALLRQAWERMKDPEIAAHLGEVLWTVGRQDEAREVWREGAAIDADNRALRRALEKFRP